MKTLILFTLFAGALIAAPADVQLTTIGPWPICKVFPDAIFCMPTMVPNYALLVRASSSDVTGFAFTIRYLSGGKELIVSGKFYRHDSNTGYSISQLLVIEDLEQLLGVDVQEVK